MINDWAEAEITQFSIFLRRLRNMPSYIDFQVSHLVECGIITITTNSRACSSNFWRRRQRESPGLTYRLSVWREGKLFSAVRVRLGSWKINTNKPDSASNILMRSAKQRADPPLIQDRSEKFGKSTRGSFDSGNVLLKASCWVGWITVGEYEKCGTSAKVVL